jgi:hypothetical protein
MALAWIVAVPAEVVERTGIFAAFGRSADLTRNHRGAIFGLAIAYWLVIWIIAMVAGVTVMALTFRGGNAGAFGGERVGLAIFMTAYQVVLGALGATGVASVYYELRSIKEGIGPEALASVFE